MYHSDDDSDGDKKKKKKKKRKRSDSEEERFVERCKCGCDAIVLNYFSFPAVMTAIERGRRRRNPRSRGEMRRMKKKNPGYEREGYRGYCLLIKQLKTQRYRRSFAALE